MSLVQNPVIVYISPAELVVHPKLIEIYGENEERPALEKSISEKGILESLKVSARTGVNVVLAGKCRLQIARQLGISTVKVEFVESGSPEEDLKLVLDFNLHRVITRNFTRGSTGRAYFVPKRKKDRGKALVV